MSRRNLGSKIKLSSYDDMFGVNATENENVVVENQIRKIARTYSGCYSKSIFI